MFRTVSNLILSAEQAPYRVCTRQHDGGEVALAYDALAEAVRALIASQTQTPPRNVFRIRSPEPFGEGVTDVSLDPTYDRDHRSGRASIQAESSIAEQRRIARESLDAMPFTPEMLGNLDDITVAPNASTRIFGTTTGELTRQAMRLRSDGVMGLGSGIGRDRPRNVSASGASDSMSVRAYLERTQISFPESYNTRHITERLIVLSRVDQTVISLTTNPLEVTHRYNSHIVSCINAMRGVWYDFSNEESRIIMKLLDNIMARGVLALAEQTMRAVRITYIALGLHICNHHAQENTRTVFITNVSSLLGSLRETKNYLQQHFESRENRNNGVSRNTGLRRNSLMLSERCAESINNIDGLLRLVEGLQSCMHQRGSPQGFFNFADKLVNTMFKTGWREVLRGAFNEISASPRTRQRFFTVAMFVVIVSELTAHKLGEQLCTWNVRTNVNSRVQMRNLTAFLVLSQNRHLGRDALISFAREQGVSTISVDTLIHGIVHNAINHVYATGSQNNLSVGDIANLALRAIGHIIGGSND